MYYLKNILKEKLNEIRHGYLKDMDHLSMVERKTTIFKNPCFIKNLKAGRVNIIAEIKKASPSRGPINTGLDITEVSAIYDEFNSFISAVSVLTEPVYFMGEAKHIAEVRKGTEMPILRKDFIFSELQVYESSLLGADCILLISSLLGEKKLKRLYLLAGALGLDVLVEVHTPRDLEKALNIEACLIGINNRNLRTMQVEPDNIFNILKYARSSFGNKSVGKVLNISGTKSDSRPGYRNVTGKVFVCESGIEKVSYIKKLYDAGINTFLMGSYFMQASNLRNCLKEFEKELKACGLINNMLKAEYGVD
ncbi:MAG: indole-3-glycerol-phosphate synthase [Actinobacteria bacterium]|nr:indole-3-glycerol-phosphate synthase [Actinomycetota bacterium]